MGIQRFKRLLRALAGAGVLALTANIPTHAQSVSPGQGSLNVPGAPGSPGTPVSPSQIPESQRLQTTPTNPCGLATPTSQLPTRQTLCPPSAFTQVTPRQSELQRQGTTDERQLTVYERPLPEYDPIGMQVGSYYLFPSVDVGYGFNSNIFATPSETSDRIFTVTPRLALRSNYEQDQLNLDLASSNGFYDRSGEENYNDYQGSINGRHYFTSTVVGFGRVGAAHLHELRTSPDALTAANPTEYNDYTAYAGLAQTGLALQLQADVFYERLQFEKTSNPGGGFTETGFRDRDQVISTVRAGYELSRALVAFVRGAYNTRMYRETQNGFNRDSWGVTGDVGFDLDINSIFVAEVFAGIMSQHYSAAGIGSLTPADFGVDAVWNVTRRTSLLFNVLRSLDETTLTGSPGILTTTVAAGAQYQFFPNLLGRIDYSHSFLDFQKTSFEDDLDSVSVGANYFIGRNIVLKPTLAYITRDSNRSGVDFDQWQGVLMMTLRY
jgi:hypothetical protein